MGGPRCAAAVGDGGTWRGAKAKTQPRHYGEKGNGDEGEPRAAQSDTLRAAALGLSGGFCPSPKGPRWRVINKGPKRGRKGTGRGGAAERARFGDGEGDGGGKGECGHPEPTAPNGSARSCGTAAWRGEERSGAEGCGAAGLRGRPEDAGSGKRRSPRCRWVPVALGLVVRSISGQTRRGRSDAEPSGPPTVLSGTERARSAPGNRVSMGRAPPGRTGTGRIPSPTRGRVPRSARTARSPSGLAALRPRRSPCRDSGAASAMGSAGRRGRRGRSGSGKQSLGVRPRLPPPPRRSPVPAAP